MDVLIVSYAPYLVSTAVILLNYNLLPLLFTSIRHHDNYIVLLLFFFSFTALYFFLRCAKIVFIHMMCINKFIVIFGSCRVFFFYLLFLVRWTFFCFGSCIFKRMLRLFVERVALIGIINNSTWKLLAVDESNEKSWCDELILIPQLHIKPWDVLNLLLKRIKIRYLLRFFLFCALFWYILLIDTFVCVCGLVRQKINQRKHFNIMGR